MNTIAVALRVSLCALALGSAAAGVGACAPPASFRPASGFIGDRTREIGAAPVLAGPRPYVDEPTRAAGQLWFSARATRKLTLTGVGAFDLTSFALGGAARLDLVRWDRFAAGGEVEAGWLWGALDLPAAVRLFDETWLYTAPRFGNRGLTWAVDVPLGLSVRIYDGLMLRAEARVSWGELSYYERRYVLGAAAAWQF